MRPFCAVPENAIDRNVARDLKRQLLLLPAGKDRGNAIAVVTNWPAALEPR